MAYAPVGSLGAVSIGATSTAVTPAFDAGATRKINDLLALWVAVTASATVPTVTAGWTLDKSQVGASSGAYIYRKVAAGSDAAPTISAITGGRIIAMLGEFSGNVVSSPLDQTAGNAGTTSPLVATAGAADLLPGELILYAAALQYSTAAIRTFTATLNNATAVDVNNGSSSSGTQYDFGYGISTADASADSLSLAFPTANVSSVSTALASYKLIPPPPPVVVRQAVQRAAVR